MNAGSGPADPGRHAETLPRGRAKDRIKKMGTALSTDDPDDARAHPWFVGPARQGRAGLAANGAVCASVPILAIAGVIHNDLPTGNAVGVVSIAAVSGVAMRYRARWPVPVLAVALLGAVTALLVGRASPALGLACEIAVFTVACLRPRRVAGVAALVSAVILLGAARSGVGGPIAAATTLIVVVWTALAFAGGVAVRSQRAYVTSLAERARRADENYEQEARTRVAEERVRIARELHDVVAHHIAVINVHAGLARRAIGRDADTVDRSLGHVQEAARTVLDELGTVLSVLRSSDLEDSAAGPTTQPAPGLERLDELLETFAGAGLEVLTSTTGRAREMDRGCDLAAFRIIQESLTNASKHGADGKARLILTSEVDGLTIDVSNRVRVAPVGSPNGIPLQVGHGLMGMRERADACGGSMTVCQDDHGVFSVVAVIPHRPRTSPVDPAAAADSPGRHRGPAVSAEPAGIA
jgi:signal transduction histidine kinase